MKLVMYERDGMGRPGMIIGDFILDLQDAWPKKTGAFPKDLLFLLKEGAETMDILQDWVPQMGDIDNYRVPLSSSQLFPPITQPGKLLCIGLNYEDHARETGKPIPKEPIIFGKYSNALVGNEQPIRIPDVTRKVDYEAELAVIMGKTAYRVQEDRALDYVAGYANFNDVSARDLQYMDGQWMKGKFLDTFAPMGPWLVTADEIKDPGALNIQLRLNGRVMQSSNTKNMIFSVAYIVSYLSHLVTLEPGDIIATGTPHGVGTSRKPPVFLTPGDTVEVEISGLGVLRNPVVEREVL